MQRIQLNLNYSALQNINPKALRANLNPNKTRAHHILAAGLSSSGGWRWALFLPQSKADIRDQFGPYSQHS
jgi:hypothetical protein